MSLDPPPPGTARANATAPRTSDDPPPTNWRTDQVLKQLATMWNTAPGPVSSPRWEAIKHLRVLRMPQNGKDGVTTDVPRNYFNAYRVGRLSAVAENLQVTELKPAHLDIDWFGRANDNWWNTPGSAVSQERPFVTALLHFLEKSVGLRPSPATNPDKWTWPDIWNPPVGSMRDGLTRHGPPQNAHPVRFEWTRDAAGAKFEFEVKPPNPGPNDVLTFCIKTPACRLSDFNPA
jgi:hypothetical protein